MGTTKYPEKKKVYIHTIHHKCHMDCPGIGPGPAQGKPGNYLHCSMAQEMLV